MNYADLSVKDFVMDEYFRDWITQPDEEICNYWESWVMQHPDKKKEVEEARNIILHINFKEQNLNHEDLLQVKDNINAAINEYEDAKLHKMKSRSLYFFNNWQKVAAVFTGLFMVGVLYFLIQGYTNTTKYTTDFAETRAIMLPDGSKVTLNANSKISYDTRWNDNINGEKDAREIWLEGEAFFSVVHKSNDQLFLVHADDVDIEVLGTKFNVNNRRGMTQVVLNSGKVKLNTPQLDEGKAIVMAPGELVKFSKDEKKFTEKNVDPQNYSAWLNNELVFNKTPFYEIAQMLEDNYGMRVTFEKEETAKRKLTGSSPADDVDSLLLTLSTLFDVQITRTGKHIKVQEK